MFRKWLLSALFLLAAAPGWTADLPEPAGRVDFVSGDIWFVDASQQKRRPLLGDYLRATDTVISGNDGELHLDMEDGGYLAVRTNTQFRVDDYRAHGDREDRMVLHLVKGALRSMTGWISVLSPKRYQVRTLTAALGVRGTDHETLFIPEGSSLGEPGTYDKVNEGATYLSHASGQIDILPRQAGFAPLAPGGVARLLDRIPDFFVASANEVLLEGRHKQVQERLQERLQRKRMDRLQQQQQQSPQSEQVKELQETTAQPQGESSVRESPASSLAPAVPAAAVPAITPAVPAAPSLPAVPSVAPASNIAVPKPAATPAIAPAAVPEMAAPAAAAASSSTEKAASPAAAPAAKEQARPASRARGVKEADKPATQKPPTRVVQPTESERERLYRERRNRQKEDHQEVYERDRDADREAPSSQRSRETR